MSQNNGSFVYKLLTNGWSGWIRITIVLVGCAWSISTMKSELLSGQSMLEYKIEELKVSFKDLKCEKETAHSQIRSEIDAVRNAIWAKQKLS